MITEEHLNWWLEKMEEKLGALESEIAVRKLTSKVNTDADPIDGVQVILSYNEYTFVSFDYLREKAFMLRGFIKCIRDDMRTDKS